MWEVFVALLWFPLWVRSASETELRARCRSNTIKLVHLRSRNADPGDVERLEASVNAMAAELDTRAWKRRRVPA